MVSGGKNPFKSEIKRINGYLKEVVTFFDDSGKPIHHTINPLMVELNPRDVMQLFIGSLIIAAPLSFTEEIWKLSETLKTANILALCGLSLVSINLFIYFNFYRHRLAGNVVEFVKRVVATYFITLSSAALILLLIDKLPIEEHPIIAFKRVAIIAFPAVFGATLSDMFK